MNTSENIKSVYDLVAEAYAEKWWNEFEKKHFDQVILRWFAAQIPKNEVVLEIGSGPGEVSGFLNNLGVKCIGTDISAKMIENAKKYFPDIQFEIQDFLAMTYENNSFYSIIAYYAIVNLTLDQIKSALREVRRVLKDQGLVLFTFHIFENAEKITVTDFLGKNINDMTVYFFKVDTIKSLVEDLGFEIIDIIMRYPYQDIEYQSKRAYFIIRKSENSSDKSTKTS